MTDFYALLKQSIIERGIRDAQDREAVYAQARQAIVKQLWAFHPPLAADEIDTRVGAYDQAVERIERDLKVTFADAGIPVREKPKPRLPPLAPPEPDPLPEIEAEADEDEIAAPPLAEWRHNDDEDHAGRYTDDDEYERGVPRAVAGGGPRGSGGYESRASYADEAPRGAAEYGRDARYEEDGGHETDAANHAGGGAFDARWRNESIEPARGGWMPTLNERAKVQVLAGAIAALVIALVSFAAFFYVARGSGDAAATVNIDVRREVSDSATATRIAADSLEVVQGYSVFDGRDPTVFATTPDNPVRFVSEEGFARVASSASAPGVKAIIGPGLAARLAGRRVRVTLVARSSTDFGAAAMRFAYQSGLAISHWQTATLAADYEAVGMIWRVPTMRTDPAGDFLVIEPGIPGDGTGVDIQSIRIDVLAGES